MMSDEIVEHGVGSNALHRIGRIASCPNEQNRTPADRAQSGLAACHRSPTLDRDRPASRSARRPATLHGAPRACDRDHRSRMRPRQGRAICLDRRLPLYDGVGVTFPVTSVDNTDGREASSARTLATPGQALPPAARWPVAATAASSFSIWPSTTSIRLRRLFDTHVDKYSRTICRSSCRSSSREPQAEHRAHVPTRRRTRLRLTRRS